ncbi:MAG: hypothetical protein QOK28_3732 [Actinomycetota bacterium]
MPALRVLVVPKGRPLSALPISQPRPFDAAPTVGCFEIRSQLADTLSAMAADRIFVVLEAIDEVAPTEDIPDVDGLSFDDVLAVLGALSKRGWITATAFHGRRVLRGQILDLTAAGRDALANARNSQDADVSEPPNVSVAEKRQLRAMFMRALYDLTGPNTHAIAETNAVGNDLGWQDAVTKPVVAYLHSKGLIAYRALGGRISITQQGIEETEDALDHPAKPTENLAPMNVTVGDLGGGTVQVVQGGSALAPTDPPKDRERWWRGVSIQAVGGIVAGLVLLLISGALTNWFGISNPNDSGPTTATTASSTSTVTPGATTSCADGPCIAFRITNTVEGGRDLGAYIRSTPLEDAVRLTGVFDRTELFGICIFSRGYEAVPGESRWVKTPFNFVEGDIASDGTFSSPRSRPDQQSNDYGWILARFLAPVSALTQLPACTNSA